MIQLLKKIFGIGPKVNYAELMANGAVIVDVRTPSEFRGGHIKGSLNMPLTTLSASISKLKK